MTTKRIYLLSLISLILFSCKQQTQTVQNEIPRLEKRGNAVQLIIDGKPFLVLGGELRNSSSSSREYMKEYWPQLDEGKFENGKWIQGRRLNGDDIMLDYDLAKKALEKKTGTGLKFGNGNELVQRVKLYRYE